MKKTIAVMIMFFGLSLAAFSETKEGKCELKDYKFFNHAPVAATVGQRVKGACRFYTTEFFGSKVVNAGIEIKNVTNSAVQCQYYVSFFNNTGDLIGCVNQSASISTGETTQFASCLIRLPVDYVDKIVQYKIAFYESDKSIEK